LSDLRPQILEAAKNLLIEQGYHGLSMRQIAEAVGVSKAALYYHFKDKEELLIAILDAYLDGMESMLDDLRRQPGSSRGKISALVKFILQQPAEQRAIIRLSSQEMAHLSAPARAVFDRVYHEKFLDKIRAIFEDGVQAKELRPVDPNVASWTLLGMMYPYFYPAHARDLPAPADVAQQIAGIFLDGIIESS
jgi:AcrR family transcriptional regulator